MALSLVFTNAGRAALINAANTGTGPTQITQIGVTATAFAAAAGMVALPGELKRLATFAGAAVADDVIHVSVADQSADVYDFRGFGLYLADGTLLALYGQADPILEKAAVSTILLAADITLTAIAAGEISFGDASWINPPATEDTAGVIRIATDAEAAAGVASQRAVSPKGLQAMVDARFGEGAPSAFVKGVLTTATAALMRAALGLGSAAVRNEGAGNGLDADLLDGQQGAYYRDRANHTGTQAIASVTGLQGVLDGKLGTAHEGAGGAVHAAATGAAAGFMSAADKGKLDGVEAGATANATNAQLRDRATHTGVQAIATISGLQGALDAKAALSGAGFTGLVTITRAGQREQVEAGPGYNGGVPVDTGDKRIAVYAWDGEPSVYISRHNINGFGMSMLADGDVRFGFAGGGTDVGIVDAATLGVAWTVRPTFAGATPWDSANFNPTTKADLAGANFTGPVIRSGVSGDFRSFQACTGGTLRWQFGGDWSLEGGANSGTNWALTRHGDDGGYIDTPLIVSRATGEAGFSVRPTFGGATPWDSGNLDPTSIVPAGAVSYFARSTAPTGWIKANGAAVSRTTYAALFAAIGTTFGAGDGATTFNLPDLRGEFLRGLDDGRGVDAGRALGSAQADELKSHTHDLGIYVGSSPAPNTGAVSGASSYFDELGTPTDPTGGAETRPRNIALLACIKY